MVMFSYKPSRLPEGTNQTDNLILLRKRSLDMLKNDLMIRNPLRVMGTEHALKNGEFGAVLARSGVGKTALLVQLALDSLLQEKNVLHISLDQPVKKVCLWYEEVFQNIAKHYEVENAGELWKELLPRRFIMTFKVEGFNVPKLEERLGDLTEQGIFTPQIVLIDGLPLDDEAREVLAELKLVAKEYGFPAWLTARTHRDDTVEPDGIPSSMSHVSDLFDLLVQLTPVGREIEVHLLGNEEDGPAMVLDPATLLIKNSPE